MPESLDTDLSDEGAQWIRDHVAKGNWVDIKPEEQIPNTITGFYRTIVHMFQISWGPEIRKRRLAGELPDDWTLYSAQMFQPYTGGVEVRLNDEVKGIAFARADRPVEKGEKVTLSDLAEIVSFDLLKEDLDAGHCTIWWSVTGWRLFFDFRPGRGKATDHAERALHYADAAMWAHEKGYVAPAIDNLHSAFELASKARLLLDRHRVEEWKSHGKVQSEINRLKKMGNIEAAFVDSFNKLSNIRSTAKYAPSETISMPSIDDIELVKSFASELLESASQREAPTENGVAL